MNVEDALLHLKHTNVSRPRLSHSGSKHSVTASEDYYSALSSDEYDDRSRRLQRFQTPPSRRTSAEEVKNGRRSPTRPRAVKFDERQIRRKPVSPPSVIQEKHDSGFASMDTNSNTTTPGVDDTPYIRFAIDQLTRDEEVRGSRQFLTDPQQQQREHALQDQRAEEKRKSRVSQPPPPPPPPPPPARQPQRRSRSPIQRDIFVPVYPPPESTQHPPLDFLPAILRPVWLGVFLLLCLLMVAGLIFVGAWSRKHNGLWNYKAFGDGRYFVFEYLPTMLGVVILMWLFQIETAVMRVTPFVSLASDDTLSRSQGVFLDINPTQFLLPTFQHFGAGQGVIGSFLFASWLFLFTVPLLASAFNVRFFGAPSTGLWRWVAVQGVIWTLVALYIILIIAVIMLAYAFWTRRLTGLKWDPRSIADIVCLLERSNVTHDYADSETFLSKRALRGRLDSRTDRLGYWTTSRYPQDIFYGIGEEGGPTRRYSVEAGRILEKPPPEPIFRDDDRDLEAGRSTLRSPSLRLHHLPWYLHTTYVVLFISIAIILLLAFLIVSFVNHAVRYGFSPSLAVSASSSGFSAANFLYSFISALLGTVLFLFWQTIDLSLRRLAPYHALSSPTGATAEKSLLLDYPARLPISVTLSALANRDWRIVLASLMTLINTTLPVLAGGVFWAQTYPNQHDAVKIAAEPSAYYALCVFLTLHALAYLMLIPGRKRMALPHPANCVAEITSWVYMSPLLTDRAFARPSTKADLVGRLVGDEAVGLVGLGGREWWSSVTSLGRGNGGGRGKEAGTGKEKLGHGRDGQRLSGTSETEKPRYGFGVFVGRDGKEHLGLDRVRRAGAMEMWMHEFRRGRQRPSTALSRFSN